MKRLPEETGGQGRGDRPYLPETRPWGQSPASSVSSEMTNRAGTAKGLHICPGPAEAPTLTRATDRATALPTDPLPE